MLYAFSHLETSHVAMLWLFNFKIDHAYYAHCISFFAVNIPLRDYQLSITEKALFSNTLVALPTGLGKTLIAAVVMYNYFRWFPEGSVHVIYSL